MTVMRLIAALLIPVFLTGCASIVAPNTFPVTINSTPPGANIVVKNDQGMSLHSGTTPATIPLKAGRSYFHGNTYYVTFTKAGYVDQQTVINPGMSGWYVGNLLFGGLIGALIVDPITGKMFNLPTNVETELAELKTQ